MKYIDAEKFKAELDRLRIGYNIDGEHNAEYDTCVKILRIIDSLQQEQTEVDLEKEIDDFIYTYNGRQRLSLELDWKQYQVKFDGKKLMDFAKRFFELGLKKGQKNIWHTMDETPNYPCDILFLTDADSMFLYRYMENGRPNDKETPYFDNILNGKCWCYCSDAVNE